MLLKIRLPGWWLVLPTSGTGCSRRPEPSRAWFYFPLSFHPGCALLLVAGGARSLFLAATDAEKAAGCSGCTIFSSLLMFTVAGGAEAF